MSELFKSFSELFESYSQVFELQEYSGSNRTELMKQVPTSGRGVYTYWVKGANYPIYIGCSGKITQDGQLSGSTIKKRIFSANTPYHISSKEDCLYYLPTSSGVPPKGYNAKLDLENLLIKIIISDKVAPKALEHLLLQAFVNEFSCLPKANQQL